MAAVCACSAPVQRMESRRFLKKPFCVPKKGNMDFVCNRLGSVGVHAGNFIYVSLYIAVVNSFLEEFFFRGFSFLCLKAQTGRKFAFLFSAAMFSLYHAAMTIGWFSPLLLCLILLVLFGTGLFLNYVDEKSQTLYNSYFMHMFANFAINTIGFILFGK